MSATLPIRRIIKFHRNFLRWTFMLSVEAEIDVKNEPYAYYQYGSGLHREWRLSWWRR